MSSANCDLSVIIATYGRPESCRRSVQSLFEALRAANLSAEITVGINGTDKNTQEILEELTKKSKGIGAKVLLFTQRETPSGFRNKLIDGASGEWIYFIDDDAFVDPDFFLKFVQVRNANQTVSVIGGPNLTPPDSNLFQRATGLTLASRFATYFSYARYAAVGSSQICGEESLILCNLFIKKEALGSNPFLAELLCCEESWLLQEMEGRGFQLLYDSSLIVWHDRRPDFISLARQVFKYGYGRGQILKKKPSRLRPAYLLPTLSVAYTFIYCIFYPLMRHRGSLWAFPFIIYPFLCMGAALSSAKRAGYAPPGLTSFISAFLFPLIHTFYGCGFFWGLVKG